MNALIVYNRKAGEIIRQAEYDSSDEAMTARFAAESEFRANRDIEVVVLSADSWQTIRRTHARYFRSLPELVQRLSASLATS